MAITSPELQPLLDEHQSLSKAISLLTKDVSVKDTEKYESWIKAKTALIGEEDVSSKLKDLKEAKEEVERKIEKLAAKVRAEIGSKSKESLEANAQGKYGALSDGELQAKLEELRDAASAARAELALVAAEVKRRGAEEIAKAEIAKLSPAARKMLNVGADLVPNNTKVNKV